MTEPRLAAVVVLAAGEGTRMRSATTPEGAAPAVRPHACSATSSRAARGLDPEHLVVVVGHAREQVTAALAELDPAARAVVQEQQHGTGHAVRVALEALGRSLTGTVVVVPGRRAAAHGRDAGRPGAAQHAQSARGDDAADGGARRPDRLRPGRARRRRRRRRRRRAQGRRRADAGGARGRHQRVRLRRRARWPRRCGR